MAPAKALEHSHTSRRRSERLEVRVTEEQKAPIEPATALEGRSITDFVLTSVQEAAKRAIAEHEVVKLSVRDPRAFVRALLDPREPSAQMRARMVTYRALMGERWDGAATSLHLNSARSKTSSL